MTTDNSSSFTASVDYLTVTTMNNKASAKLMSSLFSTLTPQFIAEAPKKRWHFMGYEGYSIEGVRYGINLDRAIVMLSGQNASALWQKVAPSRTRCTRIDLAVTVTLPEVDTSIAALAYEKVLVDGLRRGTLISNSRGGSTLYVGSRSSEQYGRLYDKSSEQGGKAGKEWRYEVECKKPKSESVLVGLLDAGHPSTWITSYVWQWFWSRGIEPLFSTAIKMNAIENIARVTSTESTLAWLSTSVRPSVQRLMQAGKEEQVYVALGLPLK